ncbi:bis(5'-nucleosyl)-tetraphosphatase (plasmid) [Legionella adelaidensis]|uniref:bis(5'-nucleosyl)-tetraphosphatase (symmetrical) n=1 Tax=Legionella adelaidensis TaxID=45056 RepID=A0A0W0R0K8_9GAMM|nr:symmetrical bis(5'-nucleosyl)-tetraphosphatase [Legionella adelaidensis]KTC64636.1 bis(5'-nucleosyl)-tetraphosphatase [Legionella adelaidensis]VEH86104.1 bis(5'-nucleosyl)-tetraphosphatase [Legionella adelaidensis]
MADYAIGDIQGCYDPLQRLLEKIHYNERQDRLWFVGDLVNRGPQSLQVIRFVKSLPLKPIVCLGNHDLHLLARIFTHPVRINKDDTLHELLQASDSEEIGHWLRKQFILFYDATLNIVMCHAGIAPIWDLPTAIKLSRELEAVLHGEDYLYFLNNMYGNEPTHWSNSLPRLERLRLICNYFTRMRFCNENGDLNLSYKGTIADAPAHLFPWFLVPNRIEIPADIVFGHWAALMARSPHPRIHALDSGCYWGNSLTAICLQDKQRYTVSCA